MLSRVATRTARRAFSTVRAGVSNTKKKQEFFQQNPHLHGADDPTWLKKGGADKAVAAAMFGIVTFSVLQVVTGVYKMSFGIGQI